MDKNQFCKITRRLFSCFAASAVITTQLFSSLPVKAYSEHKYSNVKVGTINASSKNTLSDIKVSEGAVSTTAVVTTTSTTISTNKTENVKASPVLSMDTMIVPASAAGTKVNMNVYINDNNISNDISYYTKSDIVLSIDERVGKYGIRFNTDGTTNGVRINTEHIDSSSFSPSYYMHYIGNGKNGVLSVIEVTIPEYAQPGDIFYFDICDTSEHKSHITFISSDTVIYEGDDSLKTADTSGDDYLKDTPYDGYILIQPDSDENFSTGTRPYEKVIKDSVTYAVYEDHAEVVHCDFDAEKAIILPEINGQQVTSIVDYAFVETMVKSVSIPDSIEKFGINIFGRCSLLNEIKLPEGMKEIPTGMFLGCSALEKIEIPSSVNQIKSSAFCQSGLKSIIIPDNVTTLDSGAFSGCKQLSYVKLPTNLENINSNVFQECSSLESIDLPDKIKKIGDSAFKYTKISEINIPDSVTTVERGAFSGTAIKEINYSDNLKTLPANAYSGATSIKSIKLPSQLTAIPEFSFDSCSSLTELIIPGTLISIGSYAFYNCGLKDFTITDSVTIIDKSAFAYSNIKYMEIPDKFTELPEYMFYYSNIEEIKLPSKLESIPNGMLKKCKKLTSIDIPSSVKTIEMGAFEESSLKSIVIPDGVTIINDYAFNECRQLSSVKLPANLEAINDHAFVGCTFESLELPDTLKRIGHYAFGVSFLKELNIPASVISLENDTFKDSYITCITYPDDLEILPDNAFAYAGALTTVKLPSKLTAIPNYAFLNCTKLKDISIPDTVKSIGTSAFAGSGITEIVLPDSINNLEDAAFAYSNIETLVIPEIITELPTGIFRNMNSLKSIKLPSKLKNIPDLAFYGCYSITNVEISETVTSIGKQAFNNCFKLESIYIPASVTYIYNNNFYNAFDPTRLTTIFGHTNSEAEKYANKYNIEFIAVNNKDDINTITTQTTTTIKVTTTSTTTTTTKTTTKITTEKTTTKPNMTSTTKLTTKVSGSNNSTTKKTTTTIATTTSSAKTTAVTTTASSSTTTDPSTTTEPVPPEPHRLDIQGNMTVKEMSLDDIQKAGINIADPSNYHVFEYEVEMAFAAKTYRVTRYEALPQNGIDEDSTIVDHSTTVPTQKSHIMPKITIDGVEKRVISSAVTPNEEMYMIISGECKWLKEFYDVELIVINKDNQNEMLTDCSAVLNVPDGLTLMNSKQIQSLGTLDAGSAFDVHWYVRGDVAGDYDLTAQFIGNNRGQQFTYNFKSENTLHVYAGDALRMKITVPRYSFLGEDYPVKISFKNVSDRPIYNIEHKINGISQGTYTYKSVNGKTEQDKEPIYTETLNAKKEISQLDPGDEIVAEVKIHDAWKSALENGIQDQKLLSDAGALVTCWMKNPSGVFGNFCLSYLNMLVNSITVEHVLQTVKVVTLKNSTVEVPYEVEWEEISPELAEKYSKNMIIEHIVFIDRYYNNTQKPSIDKILFSAAFCKHDNSIPFISKDDKYFNYATFLSSFIPDSGITPTILTFERDIYYKFNVPDGGGKVTFYMIKDGIRQDAPHYKVTSSNEYVNDDFDVEVLTGDYIINEDGNIIFSSDAYVKIVPKKAGIKATFGAVTDDGKETINIPIKVVDEHECKGEKFILNPPIDGDGAYMASFCSICHELIECKMLPNNVIAMLSNGECYDDIRGVIADYKNYDDENLKMYICGNINIVEDVTIPEDIMTVIVPDTKITVNDGCKLIAKGEVKDFSGYDYDLSGNGPISTKITTTSATTTTTSTTSVSTTTVTTTSPVKTIEYTLGDVNNDKMIDAGDASSVLAYYARISTNQNGGFSEQQKLAADINHDGMIDSVDASIILAYYAYLSTTKENIMSISEFMKK